ncbi:fibrinogen-like YCDxxxxGGGW domain-containing protein [Bdellovibrio bacteriovorus]|uniref:fibrinogen-like YCDxxxxGGGW domain-containing protein n=1 Tax=Bdellovibrio bacteriovorus TaxID=959 RepID=UPI0035A6BA54
MRYLGKIFFILITAPLLLALNTQDTGHRVNRSTTKAINAHNVCKKVINANVAKDFFVPTKTAAEWTSFRSNLPASVTLGSCTSCLDILNSNGSEGDGVYYVDPTGSSPFPVYCDMTTDGGGWTRLFRHNIAGGYFADAADALTKNATTPTANLHSILNRIDNFKTSGNRYHFRLTWPGEPLKNIWFQTTNPTADVNVAGYASEFVQGYSNYWSGLELSNGTHGPASTSAFLDGSVNHGNWYYGVGTYASWGTTPSGIPASDVLGSSHGVPEVNLWIREDNTHTVYQSCKAILAAGASKGDGIYTIDIDGAGATAPYEVFCDMTTSGGGWTLVAYSNGSVTASTPNDFFVNTYNLALSGRHILNQQSSINAEAFSIAVNTTDAMFVSPSYNSGAPIIDLAGGNWNYNTTKCTGNLRHTSRTAGCAGQTANDHFDSSDALNIAFNSGNEGIVPAYKATEVCYSGKGSCNFKFFLR